ncbi:MAG: cation diffusion facilitator family transporter [Patescibacteria group bacterium]|nr:cation diffusion facilitator family transporter [Patescibacteria group bacterium]
MKEKIALISILANVVLAVGKISVGLISHSSAVLADGFHAFTDIFASGIGYFGIKASQKPVDKKHPYGHYKFEVLGGLIITFILFISGVGIIYEAYKKFLNPEEIKINYLIFVVMFLSILINFFTSRLKIYYGKKENSLTLLSDGTHDKADVLASIAVLGGVLFSKYWIYADPILAVLIGLYIIKESFPLGKEAVDSLLDVSADEEIEEEIKSIAEKENIKICSLKTQKKGSAVTANLEIDLPSKLSVKEATKISNILREKLIQAIESLEYVVIQIVSHEIETGFYKSDFGHGLSWQRKGRFKDKIQEASGKGPDGYCVCEKCGYKTPHQKGVPCSNLKCSNCNINLKRS